MSIEEKIDKYLNENDLVDEINSNLNRLNFYLSKNNKDKYTIKAGYKNPMEFFSFRVDDKTLEIDAYTKEDKIKKYFMSSIKDISRRDITQINNELDNYINEMMSIGKIVTKHNELIKKM